MITARRRDPDAGPRAAGADRTAFPVSWRRLAAECTVPAAVAWLWAVWSYRLWRISPSVPINQSDDARLITNIVKNIADQGWWTTNPDLGYPIGQQLYDFPHGGETWQLATLRVMAIFTDRPGLLMNAYYFLGIGLTAVAAFLALRHLRVSFGLALVGSVGLTWLPFRIAHHQWHLFRTSFWWVPLAVVLIVWVLHWRERFLRDPDPPGRGSWWTDLAWNVRHNLRRRRLAIAAAMVVALAGGETMTTAFTLTLLALTGLFAAVRRREAATLLVHGLAIAALGTCVMVMLGSTLVFMAREGTNPEAARRDVTEQETYGLKITMMLLPDQAHRWSLLGSPAARVRETSRIPSEGGQTIGLLGAAGCIAAAGGLLARGWGRRGRDTAAPFDEDALREDMGLLVVLGTITATVGGLALLMGLAGFSQVRVWNRMTLIVAFASLAYALRALDRLWRRRVRPRLAAGAPGRPGVLRAAGIAAVMVLVAFVLWDGANIVIRTPGRTFGLDHDANADKWAADARFANQIADQLPKGSAIFQFPIVLFPESIPPGRMVDYDHLRAWVHLPPDQLKWSYGAMKGRPAGNWQLVVRDEIGESGSLPYLIGLGFDAVWLDTWGYDDAGARARAELDAATGVEPLVSDDGRTLVYDLAPLRDALEAQGTTQEDLAHLATQRLGIPPGD